MSHNSLIRKKKKKAAIIYFQTSCLGDDSNGNDIDIGVFLPKCAKDKKTVNRSCCQSILVREND